MNDDNVRQFPGGNKPPDIIGGQNNEQTTIRLNPDDLDDVSCQNCGSMFFLAPGSVVGIKHVSQIMSPTGEEGHLSYPFPGIVCVKCGTTLGEESDEEIVSPEKK